jgi:uncharacterized protein YceH (UPF0502 family)
MAPSRRGHHADRVYNTCSKQLGAACFVDTKPSCIFYFVAIVLTDVEARVLGSLIEKEITTPDYYPLSLNALVNACNQKSNRDPVMVVDEDAVVTALRTLYEKELAGAADSSDSRVQKYEHRLQEAFNFDRRETPILCELFLRGAQTPGELRSRAERMHHFDDLNEVLMTLQHLMKREPPLVKVLPRQSGMKEARYLHLLCAEVEVPVAQPASEVKIGSGPTNAERIARAEHEISTLQKELADLKAQFAQFRKQFE